MQKRLDPIIILGAGEQGRVVAHILQLRGFKTIKFLDDYSKESKILGKLAEWQNFSAEVYRFHVAFGDNALRKTWYQRLLERRCRFIDAIHPTAYLESDVTLGWNTMIAARVYINIGCTIGDNCIINTGTVLEHDNRIEQHVFIGPAVTTAGGVRIKQGVSIGMGAIINDDLVIEERCVIGSGTVVTRSTKPVGLYVGIPAHRKKDL